MIIIFKKILVICFLIFIHLIINAQNKITGKITDEKTGEAIPGATVYIPELKTGDLADKNGVYEIDNLPRVQVIVQVSFLGYKSIVEKVDLATTSSKNFVMEQAITEMNEVVVTGTSRTTEITRNPVPMITLGSKELQQNLSTNIIDAISKLPGVSAVTTGPNVSKPFIHGLGYNRVLTLFDGVRQEGQQWGDSHLNFSLFNDLQEIPDGSRDSVTRKFTKQITEADIFRPIVSEPELNSYKINVLHLHVQHCCRIIMA